MKRVVVTLCAWFSFMCAWSLSPDLVPEDFSSFKNTQYRYSDHDKILIPSDGEIIQTIVQPNYLVENGNLSLARSEYEMIAKGETRHRHPCKEILAQDFLYCRVVVPGMETSYIPMNISNNVVMNVTDNEKYEYSATLPSRTYTISYEDIKGLIPKDIDLTHGGCVELQFCFGVFVHIKRDDGGEFHCYIRTKESQSVTLYICRPGEIAFAEEMPVLESVDGEEVMALYPTSNGSPVAFNLLSKVAPSHFPMETQSLIWRVRKGENLVKSKSTTSNRFTVENGSFEVSGMGFDYAELDEASVLHEGDLYSATRTIKALSGSVSCTTKPIKCRVVREAELDGFSQREMRVCHSDADYEVDVDDNLSDETKWLHIKGNRLNVDDLGYASIYGVRYAWEYRRGSSGTWIEMPDYASNSASVESQFNSPNGFKTLYASAPQDLVASLALIKDGRKYEFRQVAYLTGFGNRKVLAKENGIITVEAYEPITEAMFDVKHLSGICLDNQTHEDSMRVALRGEYEFKSVDSRREGVLNYGYNFPSENVKGNVAEKNLGVGIHVFASKAGSFYATYTVKDGCGTEVLLKDSLVVSNLPILDPKSVLCGNASKSIIDGVVVAEVPDGVLCRLQISNEDDDFATCDYLCSEDGVTYQRMGSRGWEIPLSTSGVKRVYLKKKTRMGSQCESEAVVVELVRVGELRNNTITHRMHYVCPGMLNPLVTCDRVSGGYGTGSYSYKWIYSTDGNYYKPMISGDSLITSADLPEGAWYQPIDEAYRVRRIVISKIDKGVVMDTSDYAVISPYSKPVMSLISDKTAVCYDSLVTFTMSQDAKSLSELALSASRGREDTLVYTYVSKGWDGTEHNVSMPMTMAGNAKSLKIKQDTVVYGKLRVCGRDYYSNPVEISSGANLRPKMAYGPCRVRGGELEVNVANPEPDWTYSIEQGGVRMGGITAEVKIPKVGGLIYEVRVNNGSCEHVGRIGLEDSMFHDAFRHFNLEVNQVNAPIVTLCAGENATISNDRNEGNRYATNYEWSVNGVPVERNDTAYLSYTFPLNDTYYVIVRESKEVRGTELCQSILDTVRVKTYGDVRGTELSLDNTGYMCAGDSVQWTLGGVIGGSMTSYSYMLFDNGKSIGSGSIGPDDKVSDYVKFATAGKHTLHIKVTDAYCDTTAHLYSQISAPKNVTLEEELKLALKASPSLINEDGSGKTTTVVITATDGDADLTLDNFSYSYKKPNGEVVTGESVGGVFSIKVDSTCFTNDLLVLSVERKADESGCTVQGKVTINQTQGFSQRPSLEVSLLKDEYCSGETVTFSVPELPKFGDKELTSKDVSYAWLKNGSLAGSDSMFTVTAVAGQRINIMCMISYKYDASLRAAKVYSEEFELVGKPGVDLGKVTDPENGARSKSLCFGDSVSHFSLMVDALVGVHDTLEWQQNVDGEIWTSIPDKYRADGDLGNAQSIELLSQYYTTDQKTKYFRLKCVSECGVVSYSSNIFALKIESIPTLPEVALRSGNLVKGIDKVNELAFSPTSHYAGYSYHWGTKEDDVNQVSSNNGAQALVEGEFGVGDNSVYVYKQSIGGAQCVSPILKYDFKLCEELSIGDLMPDKLDAIRCPNDSTINLSVSSITGGTGVYKITWQYKTYGDNWIAFDENTKNLSFKVKFEEGNFHEIYIFRLLVSGLTSTTSFRAIIGCEGDYSGSSKMTNTYTVNYYEPLKSGGIDLSEETLCYGTAMSQIYGDLPSGGDGVYSYKWMRSENPDSVGSWKIITNATRQSYNRCDTLYDGAFYKRVVTDGCGTVLESRVKHIDVLPKQEILTEDVNYTKVVKSGSAARMWGVPKNPNDRSVYVWYDDDFNPLDTTGLHEIYTTKPMLLGEKEQMSHTFYAAKYDEARGCLSHNYDTLRVTVYADLSGTIYVEGTQKESEDNFWVCPGDNQVEVASESNPEGATYRWYYRTTTNVNTDEPVVGDWTLLRGTRSIPVRGERLSLDTCDSKNLFVNSTGRAKFVELKRVAIFTVADVETQVESNVIRVNVVPTMSSVNTIHELVGSLSSARDHYCIGEVALPVSGALENSSEEMSVWRNSSRHFGPWLYDKSYVRDLGFATWYESKIAGGEWDTLSVRYFNQDGYAEEFTPGEGIEHVMNKTYQVRRAVNDGCTSAYTDILPLYVSDEMGKIGNVQMYAIENGKRIYKGFEIGDSMMVGYLSADSYDCLWSLDSTFVDTMEAVKNYVSFRIEGNVANKLMSDPHIYMKRKSDGCWSNVLSIPVQLASASKGGTIGYDQTICRGTDFDAVRSITEASGEWKHPIDAPMNWSYSWQFCVDSLSWTAVSGADSVILSSEDVNRNVKLLNGKVTYFRRVATNDSMRVRYSNVVKMTYYDELKPGELSLNTDKTGFCTYDEMPTVISTAPTGGRVDQDGVSYAWYVSMDKGEFYECDGYRMNSFNLLFEDSLMSVERSKNILVDIKCQYRDVCGTVESDSLAFTLYRENRIPNIYQDNDSCDASEVTIKVIEDAYDKTYNFIAMINTETALDSVVWTSEAKERTIRRSTSMVVDQYGVYSVDETGCVSDYRYFSIDSLPPLRQESFAAPDVVCYKESFTIDGEPAIGGNGSKRYVWQYSYDNFSWEELLNHDEEDLTVVNPMVSAFYRRIVVDKCASDTSSAVFVRVREEVKVNRDMLVLNDFKCAGHSFNVKLSDSVRTVANVDYYTLWYDGQERFQGAGRGVTLPGFFEDSALVLFSHCMMDSTSKKCESERIEIYVHNAVAIDHDLNVVSCDELSPCNGTFVDVKGMRQGGRYDDKMKNRWFVSKDGEQWTEQLLQTGDQLRLRVEDTMFVRRLLSNGCALDTSNTLTIIGTKVVDYDYLTALNLNVVSSVFDSSVVLNMSGSKLFSESYYFTGDGLLPVANANSIRLPYDAETYKDSILQIIAVSDVCVSQYDVTPLRGGVISFDGETTLCGGSVIPSIVSTDVEGGHGMYTYQWQYKNSYTGNYINIDGATDRDYTPQAVSVATDYRRLTMDGEYTSISNAITISIRPLPKVRNIYVPISDSVFVSLGLNHTQYSMERLPIVRAVMKDSVTDADHVMWQKSYDALAWENVESMDAEVSNIYYYESEDTTSVVYYRVIGVSECGADTSKAFKVTTLYASFITDEELVLVDSICMGDPYVRIAYKVDYSDKYEYSYRAIGFKGGGAFQFRSDEPIPNLLYGHENRYIRDTTKVPSGVVFSYPERSFDVEITRYVKQTGASSTKMVHFFVDDLKANFSYVVDGIETHMGGGEPHSVRLNQGSKVKFVPEVSSSLLDASLSYKWYLIEPLNADFYALYGGSEGREGVTSVKESPSCYFYNPLDYTVKMTVTDGMCSATVVDNAMYVDKSTFRHYLVDASFEEEDEIHEMVPNAFSVYPNPCVDFLHVRCVQGEMVELHDMKGVKLFVTLGGEVEIDMRPFAPGSYLLRVGEEEYVILKR